jgi:hypothetical protein
MIAECRTSWQLPAVITILLLFFCQDSNAARQGWQHKEATEKVLDGTFELLQRFKALCGHFPFKGDILATTAYDPKVLDEARKTCPNLNLQKLEELANVPGGLQMRDGWNQPMKYSSDGKSFEVRASHGYYLTDKTTVKPNGLRWDNPQPPPNDIPPSPKPCKPSRNRPGYCSTTAD